MSKDGQCRLFVAGFPRAYESSDLERKFEPFGELKEVLMKKGFAFVEFRESADAAKAMGEVHDEKIDDDKWVVCNATPKESRKSTRLFVANYPRDFKNEDIEKEISGNKTLKRKT